MAKTIESTQADRDRYREVTELLGLKELEVVGRSYNEKEQRHEIVCVAKWDIALCPDCLQVSEQLHDYPRRREIHDVPLRGEKVVLHFDSRRFACKTCASSFTQEIQDVMPECTYTRQLYEEVADPERKQDASTLAALYGIGYKIAESILLKAGEAKEAERRKEPLRVQKLGIDEISKKKGHGDYVLVLTDLERRIVLDVLTDRYKETLVEWLQRPPDGIDLSELAFAATDLWAHYRDAVQRVHPAVTIVADRFHVVQNLHRVIDKVRRTAQNRATSEEERKQLKGLRYLLLKNEQNLSTAEAQRLTQLADSHPDLFRLWQLRQELHDWYEVRTSPEQARPTLQQWIADAQDLGSKHLDSFCNTLQNWQAEILGFFHERITSGFVEGINSKIRVLKRIAFGIPNFDHFRLRIIGFCG